MYKSTPAPKPFPPLSIGDSIDWEDPDPYTIYDRIVSKTESGSILLFHNDLENTTEALPQILTELLQKGFEFVKAEDIIYTENFYIDNTGKQIFEPVTSAINPVVIYSDDAYANSAFEKMRLNLTLEEIYNLSTYGRLKIEVIEKNQTYLSNAEIAALQMMSYEELYAAYIALVYAAETYGTADYDPNAETTTTTTTEAPPAETSTTEPAPTTTATDKTDVTTAYDKTDIVVSDADKTEIVTITMADKTEAGSGYIDKTETSPTTYYDKTEPIVITSSADTSTSTSSTTSSILTTLPPETAETSDTTTERTESVTAETTSDRADVQGGIITAETTTEPKG